MSSRDSLPEGGERPERTLRARGWVMLLAACGALALQARGLSASSERRGGETIEVARLSDAEIETVLLEGRVVDRKQIEVGITLPDRVWLEHEGRRLSAAFKYLDYDRPGLTEFRNAPPELNFKDSFRYERAAYLLDRLLGLDMVPVSVLRRLQGKRGALVVWIDDAITEKERLELKLAPEDTRLLIRQRASMRLFDALIYNLDNNLGNQLWTQQDWKLHLIDHSRSFRQRKSLPEGFSKRPVSLTPELYETLRGLDRERLEEALEEALSPGEIKTLQARLDLILEKIELDRREYGDPYVFLGMPPPVESETD